ncbi:MAG: hypothetical protein F4X58_13795 [Chloroflexi bacterium]|nr:hypothetical protein [Chloroflexota bacterium]MYC02979.1 hypothetical protein [Chloroflexota bacterium]
MTANTDARQIRDKYISLPNYDDGYSRVMLVGTTGAGKTTLLRHLIGSDPNRDRFPSTSTAKTTTAEIEIVTAPTPFKAVVTFATHDEVLGDVQDCVTVACEEVVRGSDDTRIANALLEHPEQRFRLSYLIGSWQQRTTEDDMTDEDESYDTYNDDTTTQSRLRTEDSVGTEEVEQNNAHLRRYVQAIRELATVASQHVATEIGEYEEQKPADRAEWFADFFHDVLRRLDGFADLVDDILTQIERRFEMVHAGTFEGTSDLTLEFPECWRYETSDRNEFLRQVRWFSSNHHEQFGRLLTPLVNGVRVQGPMWPTREELALDRSSLVLIDGEGLGHSAKEAGTISTTVSDRFGDVDLILLVDNAAQPMQAAPLQLLRAAGTSGHADKVAVAFTHFDQVAGDNLKRASDKREHVIASVNGALLGLQEQLPPRVSETLSSRLKTHTFLLGALHRPASRLLTRDAQTLRELMDFMRDAGRLPTSVDLLPIYDFNRFIDLELNDATEDFRTLWQGRLGRVEHPDVYREHWARIKALCRRLAFFRTNEYRHLRPVAELIDELQSAVSDWLEEPDRWTRRGTQAEERAVVDDIRQAAFQRIHEYAQIKVVNEHIDDWEEAFEQRGTGSTRVRARLMVEQILEPAAPPIHSRSRRTEREQNFRDEIRDIVRAAVEDVAERQGETNSAPNTSR